MSNKLDQLLSGEPIASLVTIYPSHASMQAEVLENTLGKFAAPIIGFVHGGRLHFDFAASMGQILEFGKVDIATKELNQRTVDDVFNRATDKGHVKEIAAYLSEKMASGLKYTLPAWKLASSDTEGVHIYGYVINQQISGFIVIERGATLPIFDAVHRTLAAAEVKRTSPDDAWPLLDEEQFNVTLTIEENIEQIHQDFTDLAKTKPIAASLVRSWDQSNPHSRITKAVSNRSPLFMGRIDVQANALGRTPDIVLTMSQLSLVLAELLYGGTTRARMAESNALRGQAVFDVTLQHALGTLSRFAEHNRAWAEVTKDDAKPDFFNLRQTRLDFNSTGLQAIFRAMHTIAADSTLNNAERDVWFTKIAKQDYQRRNKTGDVNVKCVFYGSILGMDGVILNKRATIDRGAVDLLKSIGYKSKETSEAKVGAFVS